MTAVEKFAICRALFLSQIEYVRAPLVVQQWTYAMNAVADAVCQRPDENQTFKRLCGKDQWLDQDNPFADD